MSTNPIRLVKLLGLIIGVLLVLGVGMWWSRGFWRNHSQNTTAGGAVAAVAHHDESPVVELSSLARKNLGLIAMPLKTSHYWRVLELPGVIVDWPGISDRGVVAPIVGVVTKIHAFPGNSVAPNAPLFTIRLVSESLHAAQLELFKATKEIELARQQHERLAPLAESGAVPRARIIEIENQIERLNVMVAASRQDLQTRGLPADRIAAAARGEFATEIIVRAPAAGHSKQFRKPTLVSSDDTSPPPAFSFEVQSLHVELGQQVAAGEVLCYLADHRLLQIEGRAFKDDIPWLQQAARNGWQVEVDIVATAGGNWPAAPAKLQIEYLANVADRESRTYSFFLALENQWQVYTQDDVTHILWRFQPGTRVQLRVPVEAYDNVLVVPREAIIREGGEVFVFVKKLNRFERQSVRLLHEDRRYGVLAADKELRSGSYVVTQAAAALNRILKAQQMGDQPQHQHDHSHAH